jgi:hypothetical protein
MNWEVDKQQCVPTGRLMIIGFSQRACLGLELLPVVRDGTRSSSHSAAIWLEPLDHHATALTRTALWPTTHHLGHISAPQVRDVEKRYGDEREEAGDSRSSLGGHGRFAPAIRMWSGRAHRWA